MKTLQNDFENNNIHDVVDALLQNKPSYPLPALTFRSKDLIEPGYYCFSIGNVKFHDAWIEPRLYDQNPIDVRYNESNVGNYLHATGSYRIVYNED